MAKKKVKWVRPRHIFVRNVLAPFILTYTKIKYGVKIEPFKAEGDRQYLVISNHQTGFDQFFVEAAFKKHIYFIATEDLFSMGWVSKLLSFLVAPIPFKKSTSDLKAIKTCVNVAKEGGSIGLFPEGNRTYCGRTVFMKSSIASLVKMLRLPVAFFKIEGGYGIQPRWSDVCRKGTMKAGVTRVMEPEEYKDMSVEELFEVIQKELWVDETKIEDNYYHKQSAEYLDRAMYVCPDCGLSEFYAKDDIITCTKCGKQIQYLPNKKLQGVGFDFPFTYVADWYDYQCNYISNLDLNTFGEEAIYSDKIELFEVILYKNKQKLADEIEFCVYKDKYTLKNAEYDLNIPFNEVSAVSVLGKNKLNIYANEQVFQVRGDKHFNALKYMNLYYHAANVEKGESKNGEFLGL